MKNLSNFLFLLYLVGVSIFIWQLHKDEDSIIPELDYPKYISYFLIIIGVNFLLVYPIVFISIKAGVFPYSLWIVDKLIVGDQCISYSQDLATLIERSYILMCTNALQKHMVEGEEDIEFIESDYLKAKKLKFGETL